MVGFEHKMQVVRNHGLAGADGSHCTRSGPGSILEFGPITLADNDWGLLFQFTDLVHPELARSIILPGLRRDDCGCSSARAVRALASRLAH